MVLWFISFWILKVYKFHDTSHYWPWWSQRKSGKLGPNRDPRASRVSTLFTNTVIFEICACFPVLETVPLGWCSAWFRCAEYKKSFTHKSCGVLKCSDFWAGYLSSSGPIGHNITDAITSHIGWRTLSLCSRCAEDIAELQEFAGHYCHSGYGWAWGWQNDCGLCT